jgi:hypothetical protein
MAKDSATLLLPCCTYPNVVPLLTTSCMCFLFQLRPFFTVILLFCSVYGLSQIDGKFSLMVTFLLYEGNMI